MTDALQGLLLDEVEVVSRADLCDNGWVTSEELDLLIALGLVRQRGDGYPAVCLSIVRRAARLKRGLEADWESVAVIMDLLQEIEALKNELRSLRAREHQPLARTDGPTPLRENERHRN